MCGAASTGVVCAGCSSPSSSTSSSSSSSLKAAVAAAVAIAIAVAVAIAIAVAVAVAVASVGLPIITFQVLPALAEQHVRGNASLDRARLRLLRVFSSNADLSCISP